jgi:dihydropteroate synthase
MGGRLWKIDGREVDLRHSGMIMGVLNVTPDSFSDGGQHFAPDQAVERALQMVSEGAHIIDVGGESTRPGAEPVSAEEELRRVAPVIGRVREQSDILISVDTSKASVAQAALEAGANIVNDVTGGRGDAEMFPLVAREFAGLIIMHMQGTPQTMQIAPHYDDVVSDVSDFFRQRYARALECGIDPMAMAFDPGIGFGKTLAHNLELLANLERIRVEDRPLAVGVSRKAFLAKVTGLSDLPSLATATASLTALLRSRGAEIFRVHDVRKNAAALRLAEAILDI